MKISVIGGGPAGLYFAILMKKVSASHDITVHERNGRDDTFGFGVVFSDATLGNLAEADPESYARIRSQFAHWDDIETHVNGATLRSSGHGFCGLGRRELLNVLQSRCLELGVTLRCDSEVASVAEFASSDLVVGADGISSLVRESFAEEFKPRVEMRSNRFVWLGTTVPFSAFTFLFKRNAHGLWRVHAYRYSDTGATFIVECTDETFRRTGLDERDEDRTTDYLEKVFASELNGHRLIKNRSIWRRFPTVNNQHWHHDKYVLVGDAAHTAHFSIGSGTKLAMEDGISLSRALAGGSDVGLALQRYEEQRRPQVESLQRAAQASLEWFEAVERYEALDPVQFEFSLLTRSLRVTHANLKKRDHGLVDRVDHWYRSQAFAQAAMPTPAAGAPPMFAPAKLRELLLDNRVVFGPVPQDKAPDGIVGDWHIAHLGARAIGGAGLVMTEPVAVAQAGQRGPYTPGLFIEAHARAWKRVVKFVHRHADAPIAASLSYDWRGEADITAAVSDLTPQQLRKLTEAFVQAAHRAHDANFDALELDFANGAVVHSFLSPLTNRRTDDFGGGLAQRQRLAVEVFAAVRRVWPSTRPMGVRLSATDWCPDGAVPRDAVVLAQRLKEVGCDVVAVTSGGLKDEFTPAPTRLFQARFSDQIRQESGLATIVEGGISSFDDINSLLAAGRADLCSVRTAQIFDPNFTRRAALEQKYHLQWPKPYAAVRGFVPR